MVSDRHWLRIWQGARDLRFWFRANRRKDVWIGSRLRFGVGLRVWLRARNWRKDWVSPGLLPLCRRSFHLKYPCRGRRLPVSCKARIVNSRIGQPRYPADERWIIRTNNPALPRNLSQNRLESRPRRAALKDRLSPIRGRQTMWL